ncbi:hypothetical protein FACS189485_05750 [Spirochaetia bacterium]|nr:hypothetical protein FACS189485_05750 [Spirochaetia bacterium]
MDVTGERVEQEAAIRKNISIKDKHEEDPRILPGLLMTLHIKIRVNLWTIFFD